MRHLLIVAAALCVALSVVPADASVMDQIKSHNAKGKTVFVLLTDASVKDLEGARRVVQTAQKQVPNSEMVELNRGDAANRAAVAHYRVSGAPAPLVLVVASNGLPVGAAKPHAEGAVQRIVGLVPTPAKAKYLEILNRKKVAMVVFSRRTMKEQSPLFEQITALSRTPKLPSETVLVDLDSAVEKGWVASWNIKAKKVTRPLVVFVNPQGKVIGKLEGAPSSKEMFEMAGKKVKTCGCGKAGCKGGHKN